MPDQRHEQAYLLSIRPFIHVIRDDELASREQEDEHPNDIFEKPVRIDWGPLLYLTIRDQVARDR